ncbi:MAG TPA: amidohydrolase family protein, partial [Thermoanaerobaculia bacterium]|nr:amidohydrolase family protein [Thermoanaerobaculia bacterium]
MLSTASDPRPPTPDPRALLIRNLSQIATPLGRGPVRGSAMRRLSVSGDAVIVIREGRFAFVGREADIDNELRAAIDDDFDARGATALPGFIDSHTHLPFAGYRETEFNRRLHGETYEQIAASGGGIASSVLATRRATPEELVENILGRAETMARHGTTTAEAKSGYGLTLDAERKQLLAIREANERSPVRLIPTCLAAHDFPPESRGSAAARRGYVSTIIGE